jgi:hypothetical protein
MVIWFVWGKKNTRRRLGTVADYCPICHEAKAFELFQLGSATHVYLLAVGPSRVTGHVITCTDCWVELDGDPRRYASVLKKAPGDLRALAAATHPQLASLEQGQREQVRRLRGGEMHGRPDAVLRPLYLVAVAFERRRMAMKLGLVGWLFMLTIAGLGSVWIGNLLADLVPALAPVGYAILPLLFLALVVERSTDRGRYLKKVTYPALRRALTPLRPTSSELAAAQAQLSQLKLTLAKRLGADDVQRVLSG